jgi:RND family efflux transporter MFP subunit
MTRYSESDHPESEVSTSAVEELRRENDELRRQVAELRRASSHGSSRASVAVPAKLWRPSRLTVMALCLCIVILFLIAFIAGYLPLHARMTRIANEAQERENALPRVEVVTVGRSSRDSGLQLPGNIQAVTEAPILARADGYIKRRLVDIGDAVHAGQTLAEIEAPELDEQVHQAEAVLRQARAGVDQAKANLQQGQSDLELARVTAKRWANLVSDGSVSVQENDQYQAQYQSKIAAVHALEQALSGQLHGVDAAEANLGRVQQMTDYRTVSAPFDGVITLRNVDSGALVSNGSTLLFRIAQTGTLRIYLNVPQTYAGAVHQGDAASVTVSNLPGSNFSGEVARTADSLDPASRTLLVEVHVPNPNRILLPGMYAQVNLSSSRARPPLLIPSSALIVSSEGTQVALVRPDHRLHLQRIAVGRDYGDRMEVANGLQDGDAIVASPSDVLKEGTEVEPVAMSSVRQ